MRLIDADALMKDLEKWLKEVDPTHPTEVPPMEDIIVSTLMTIEEQPTVEERKTGKWIQTNPLTKPWCSVCGAACFGLHGFDYKITPYCPECGARMEESERC